MSVSVSMPNATYKIVYRFEQIFIHSSDGLLNIFVIRIQKYKTQRRERYSFLWLILSTYLLSTSLRLLFYQQPRNLIAKVLLSIWVCKSLFRTLWIDNSFFLRNNAHIELILPKTLDNLNTNDSWMKYRFEFLNTYIICFRLIWYLLKDDRTSFSHKSINNRN